MGSVTQSRLTIDGSLAVITLATEGGLNVMSTGALGELGRDVEQVAKNPAIRFTVIRAEGKVFVAGADIKEMAGYNPDQARRFGESGSGVCDAIEALPSITVAALQGAALGGGFEIALACDFRIAVAQAKVGLPETTLGLIPGWGGIHRTVKLAGVSKAKRLIFSGTPVGAEEAKVLGLIDQVVADQAALVEAVAQLRSSFVKGGPSAIALTKQAIRNGKELDAFAACFARPESREGMSAFAEKRAASWVTK